MAGGWHRSRGPLEGGQRSPKEMLWGPAGDMAPETLGRKHGVGAGGQALEGQTQHLLRCWEGRPRTSGSLGCNTESFSCVARTLKGPLTKSTWLVFKNVTNPS